MTAFPNRRRYRGVSLALALALIAAWPFAASAQSDARSVLMLFQEAAGGDAGQSFSQGLQTQLQAQSDTNFFSESFNFRQVAGTPDEIAVRNYLTDRYSDAGLDLVIAAGQAPLQFLLANRSSIGPDTPVLFTAVPGALLDVDALPVNVTGILGHFNVDPTLELARRLQPEADRIVVVSGSSVIDQVRLAGALAELSVYQSRFEIGTLSGLTIEETERRLSELSENTIVIVLTMIEDAAGHRFVPIDVATARLAAASSAPVYGI